MTPAATPLPATGYAGPAQSPLEAMEAEGGQQNFAPPPGMRPPPGAPPGAIPPPNPNPTSRSFIDELDKIRNKVPDKPAAPTETPAVPEKKETAREALSWKPKKADDWKILKGIANQNQNRVAELEAELLKLRPGQPSVPEAVKPAATLDDLFKSNPELAKLKAERDEFYEEIKHVRVESDPEFKARFDTPREAAIKIARGASGGAADEVAKILSISDAEARADKLSERIKDFSEGSRQKIIAVNAQLTQLDVARDIEIAQRKATWETRQQAQAGQQVAMTRERQVALNKALKEVESEWSDGMPLFQMREGDNEWNSQVAERKQLANHIFNGALDPKELAQSAYWAAAGPAALEMARQAEQRAQEWQTAYARLTGVQPDSLGHAPTAGATAGPAPGTPEYMMHFTQRLDELRRQG